MIKHSWKIIGVLLVAYSLLAGLLIPLTTGIRSVTPAQTTTGQPLELTLSRAYNANFTADADNYLARIRLNPDQALCAERIEVADDQTMRLFFEVPAGTLPVETVTAEGKKSPFPLLELLGDNNGYSSLESVTYFKPSSKAPANEETLCEAIPMIGGPGGFTFPFLNILEESIRNLYYHVPMWFGMMVLMFISVVYSVRHLSKPEQEQFDTLATAYASVGVVFGLVGVATGALWAKYTWGSPWSFDVKQNTTAVALLIYLAYFVLRSSFDDLDQRARVSAIYNIFAFAMLIPLLYIVPRMFDSLHPGMGGNPAFSKLDLDNTMRMVFYPAVLGWILMGIWMSQLAARAGQLQRLVREQAGW